MFRRDLLAATITVMILAGLAWILGAALAGDLLTAFAAGMVMMAVESALMEPKRAESENMP